jgi:hypothetical protein
LRVMEPTMQRHIAAPGTTYRSVKRNVWPGTQE